MLLLDIKLQIDYIKDSLLLRYHDKNISTFSPGIEFNNIKEHDKIEPFSSYISQGLREIQEFVYKKSLKGSLWVAHDLCTYNKYVTVCKPKFLGKTIFYIYSISLNDWKYHFEFFIPSHLISYNLFINKNRFIEGWLANNIKEGDILSNFFKEVSKHMFQETKYNFLIEDDKNRNIEISWKKRKHLKKYNYYLS